MNSCAVIVLMSYRTALHLICARGLGVFITHVVVGSKANSNMQDRDACKPMHRVSTICSWGHYLPSAHLWQVAHS